MAVTSNQESQKKLGIANWRKLHHWLSYIGLFTLSWHVLAKMSGHYTIFTWLSLVLLTTISLLYSLRKDVEFQFFNPVNPKQKD